MSTALPSHRQPSPSLSDFQLNALSVEALFDDLRDPNTRISSSKPLPEHLFIFSKEEMAIMDAETQRKLIPAWFAAKAEKAKGSAAAP